MSEQRTARRRLSFATVGFLPSGSLIGFPDAAPGPAEAAGGRIDDET
jgi:hypothetical protein